MTSLENWRRYCRWAERVEGALYAGPNRTFPIRPGCLEDEVLAYRLAKHGDDPEMIRENIERMSGRSMEECTRLYYKPGRLQALLDALPA